MINAITHLRMFDAVVNHAYIMQNPSSNTLAIPQEDFEKFENARRYALMLNRNGLLYDFYKRLVGGTV